MKFFDETTNVWNNTTPNPKAPIFILGLSISTKHIGVAVEYNRELVEWRVRRFRGKWSEDKLRTILRYIERLIDKHSIEAIAVKTPETHFHTEGFSALKQALHLLSKQKDVAFYTYTIRDLKAWYKVKGTPFKEVLMHTIIERRPELTHEYHKENKYRTGYYTKIFEAIACIHLCYRMWDY